MNARNQPKFAGEPLPEGETLIWEGRPEWRSLSLRAFHIRKAAVYFSLILISRFALEALGLSKLSAAGAGWLVVAGFISIGTLALLAWIYCLTTSYAITSKRIVMRFGVALPITLNIPFHEVASAAAKLYRDGTADIPLSLVGPGRILTYPQLWPFARPWHLNEPQPMLRSVPNGSRVMGLLADALQAASVKPSSVTPISVETLNARSAEKFTSAAA